MKKKSAIIGWGLICGGVICIAAAGFMKAYAYHQEAKLLEAYTAQLYTSDGDDSARGKDSQGDSDTNTTQQGQKYETGDTIGMITIPALELATILVEGTGADQLKAAVGHVSGTALPGQVGNCAIAGHRNHTFGQYFNRLDELELGDTITLEMAGVSYEYQVVGIEVVEPTEVSVLEPTKTATLTLITCTPLYIASHRLIVTAELVE